MSPCTARKRGSLPGNSDEKEMAGFETGTSGSVTSQTSICGTAPLVARPRKRRFRSIATLVYFAVLGRQAAGQPTQVVRPVRALAERGDEVSPHEGLHAVGGEGARDQRHGRARLREAAGVVERDVAAVAVHGGEQHHARALRADTVG